MTQPKCPEAAVLLDYAVGRLADDQSDSVGTHLETCPACQAALETIHDADDTLVRHLREPLPDAFFLEEPQCGLALARAKAVAGRPEGESEERSTGGGLAGGPQGTLGEYRLLERLGQGGMGTVYRALHTKLNRVVALKVLPKGRLEDRQAIARFEREMRAVGQLDHPHIVQAYDAREIDDVPVLVMQYVEGVDLAELLQRVGRLSVGDACEVARQAALALQYAHEHGLVHRDVKPSNLMLTRQGELKLLDLGLARFYAEASAGAEVTGTGQTMGTADYMAPEQVSDSREVDIRADVYSLGCTLYKLLSGRAPFSGPEYPGSFEKMTAHVSTPAPPIRQIVPEVPDALASLLDRVLAKAPDDRPATPAEVAESLAPFCAGHDLGALVKRAEEREPAGRRASSQAQPEGSAPCPAPSTKARRSIRLPVAVGLMLLSFVAGLALGIVVTIKRNGQETRLAVPDGANVNVDAAGNVEVALPPGTEAERKPLEASAAQSDAQAIQGTWKVVKSVRFVKVVSQVGSEFKYKSTPERLDDDVESVEFTQGWMLSTGSRGRLVFGALGKCQYSLMPTQHPKQINLEYEGQLFALGIYELDGDRLKIVYNESLKRPKAFPSESEVPTDEGLLVLERVHATEAKAAEGERAAAVAELDALRGWWEVVSVEEGEFADFGTKPRASVTRFDPADVDRVLIRDDLGFYDLGQGLVFSFNYKIDPSRSPGTIDLSHRATHSTPPETVALGIYSLEGDTLRICVAGYLPSLVAEQRPEDFRVERRSGDVLFTLRRYEFTADEKALQEAPWRFVSAVVDGRKLSDEDLVAPSRRYQDASVENRRAELFFEECRFSANANFLVEWASGGAPSRDSLQGLYTLDPSQQPKAIKLNCYTPSIPGQNPRPRTTPLAGIYELTGDRLRIAWREGGPPPEAFKSEPGSGVTMIELEREKAETPDAASASGVPAPAGAEPKAKTDTQAAPGGEAKAPGTLLPPASPLGLSIETSVPKSPAFVGATAEFTFTVSNNTGSLLRGVEVAVRFDPQLVPKEAPIEHWPEDRAYGWRLDTLPAGADRKFQVKCKCNAEAPRARVEASVTAEGHEPVTAEAFVRIVALPKEASPSSP